MQTKENPVRIELPAIQVIASLALEDFYSLTLLILTTHLSPRFKWCRNKREFKYFPSNTSLANSERRTPDCNGRGPLFNPNIFVLDFILFSRRKASGVNIANFMCL